jgi:hypothetical protein
VSGVTVERNLLRLEFAGDDLASARILAAVVAAGVPVIEWRVEAAGFEELFLHITGNGDGVVGSPEVKQ